MNIGDIFSIHGEVYLISGRDLATRCLSVSRIDGRYSTVIPEAYYFTLAMNFQFKMLMSSPKIYTGPLTQEEIDEIIESYNNSVPGIIPQNTGVGSSSNISFEYSDEDNLVIGDGWHEYNEGWYNDSPPACRHKWKKYVGLSQSFEYCEICDKKKDEV